MLNALSITTLGDIKKGKKDWGPEVETVLDGLAEDGYIEIVQKHRESISGNSKMDLIIVKLTEKGQKFIAPNEA